MTAHALVPMSLAISLEIGLACNIVLSTLVWAVSVWRRDASLVDRFWSVFFALQTAIYASVNSPNIDTASMRWWAVVFSVGLWSVRLCWHLTRRNWGHGEDRRYRAIRARHQPHYAIKSLFLIFWLQAGLAWLLALPIAASLSSLSAGGALDYCGLLVCGIGLLIEAIADAQLTRFRATPGSAGQVLNRGLWRYTRHPNYFGEAVFWWGQWLFVVGAWGIYAVPLALAPALMTLLLRRVSGVTLMEQDIGERRPGYRDYVQNTPAFIPRLPKRR